MTSKEIAKRIKYLKDFSLDPTQSTGVVSTYSTTKYMAGSVSGSSALYLTLNKFESRFKDILDESPMKTHMVVTDDTLQSIAIQYYNDSSQWKRVRVFNCFYGWDGRRSFSSYKFKRLF